MLVKNLVGPPLQQSDTLENVLHWLILDNSLETIKSRQNGRKTLILLAESDFFLEMRGECHWQDNLKIQVTEILITFLFYQTEEQTLTSRQYPAMVILLN